MPADWELCTIVNCYKGKGYSLEKRKYRGVNLTDQVLKIPEKVINKVIKQQTNIDETQFDFMPVCGNKNAIFILRQLQQKYLAKNKNLGA